jgi:flagellar hook assembly protein FlgD
VYPSPFYLPAEKPMKVAGLPFESSMMIMTLDGSVVRKITNQGISIDGDQLSWDGRDKQGDYVSSGVYLLAIYGLDGKNMVEKITVLRR